jgi:c-di-GMP-related signal transduction protein
MVTIEQQPIIDRDRNVFTYEQLWRTNRESKSVLACDRTNWRNTNLERVSSAAISEYYLSAIDSVGEISGQMQ